MPKAILIPIFFVVVYELAFSWILIKHDLEIDFELLSINAFLNSFSIIEDLYAE